MKQRGNADEEAGNTRSPKGTNPKPQRRHLKPQRRRPRPRTAVGNEESFAVRAKEHQEERSKRGGGKRGAQRQPDRRSLEGPGRRRRGLGLSLGAVLSSLGTVLGLGGTVLGVAGAVLGLALLGAAGAGCGQQVGAVSGKEDVSAAQPARTDLVLASTTSTQDSGLFDVLMPAFDRAYPQYVVKVVAVGSGEALKLGETGDADVLLVHSPAAEEAFMASGFGVRREPVMYNDFVIVGPAADPAGISGLDAAAAFAKIAQSQALFYSRGDKSGTHAKELALWRAAQVTPQGTWYLSTGQGMGETLTIADQKDGYTLADRGTYLAKESALQNLVILVEGDEALRNEYHVITVKAAPNGEGANAFLEWIISAEVQQEVIGKFGVEKYGQPLFTPNAGRVE